MERVKLDVSSVELSYLHLLRASRREAAAQVPRKFKVMLGVSSLKLMRLLFIVMLAIGKNRHTFSEI